jgi:hypothetical protein
MFSFGSSISADQRTDMAKSLKSTDPCSKPKQINQFHKNKKTSNSPNHHNIPACRQSRYAMIDLVILIAVIGACGFLLYPFARILLQKTFELGEEVVGVVREEILRSPMVFGCLGLSAFFATTAFVAIKVCTDNRCGKPGCQGLRGTAEFDIQLETEESVKNSTYLAKSAFEKGMLELLHDRHRELEAELKKMAPPNGRAVLVFRERCGCPVARIEIPGPRKSRMVKK